ncbi:hypothetical protein ABBQ32_000393 [Trebouxia sp. C0010 RCD-2024]
MDIETLRLRFDDPALHLPEQAQHLSQLQNGMSVSDLYRVLEQTDTSTSERFLKLQSVALQQCQETDESDLQRLRKHFKTLKNTFTIYDLKEGFIDGLLQGLPDGTEEEQLYQFEEEMERNSVMLRQCKSSNEQAQAEMNQMVDKLSHTRQQYTSQRDQCAAQLQQLDDEQAAYELEQAQLPQPSVVDYAALQEQYAAELEAETDLQNRCAAACAAQQANIQQLEAEVKSASDTLHSLESQVATMVEMRKSEAKESEVNHRFAEHAHWCKAMSATLQALSGVSINSASSDKLELTLTTKVAGDRSMSQVAGAAQLFAGVVLPCCNAQSKGMSLVHKDLT